MRSTIARWNDGTIIRGADAFDEAAVDLQFVEPELVQILQARVARPEVVKSYLDADASQAMDLLLRALLIREQDALGYLDLQTVCGEPRRAQLLAHYLHDISVVHLCRRNIDRNIDAGPVEAIGQCASQLAFRTLG